MCRYFRTATLLVFAGVGLSIFSSLMFARNWVDASGKYSVEAEFVSLEADIVRLRKEDGRVISVELLKLSAENQELAKKLAADNTHEPPNKKPIAAKSASPHVAPMPTSALEKTRIITGDRVVRERTNRANKNTIPAAPKANIATLPEFAVDNTTVSLEPDGFAFHEPLVSRITHFDLSSDGTLAVIGKANGEISFADFNDGHVLESLHPVKSNQRPVISSVSIDRRAERIATGINGVEKMFGVVIVWNGQSGHALCEVAGNNGEIMDAAVSPDGNLLAVTQSQFTIDQPPQIAVYELPTAKLIWRANIPPIKTPPGFCDFDRVVIAPDSKSIIAEVMYQDQNNKTVQNAVIFDAKTGAVSHLIEPKGSVGMISLTVDGNLLVQPSNGGNDARSSVWDIASGKEVRPQDGAAILQKVMSESGVVNRVLPGNRRVLAADRERLVLSDWATGKWIAWMISFGNDWAVVTSDNSVDGSDKGLEAIVVTQNGRDWTKVSDLQGQFKNSKHVREILVQR